MARRIASIALFVVAAGGVIWFLSFPQQTGPAEGTTIEGSVTHPLSPARDSFRIGTFNIHGCTGEDGRRDVARVAECLAGLDFAALNEVHGPRPWERDDQAALLGRQTGLQWLFAPATRNWHAVDFGNGFLTALPIESWKRIPLSANNSRGNRNAVLVRLLLRDRPIEVLLTHIARSDDRVRRAELREVIDLYLSLPAPAVLLGDLNSEADEPEIERLLGSPGVIDAVGQKLGAAAPKRIDWIFVRGLKVLDAGLRDNGASDHPLAWAEIAPMETPGQPTPQRDKM